MASESSPLQDGKKEQSFILRNIKIFTRTVGLLTLGVLWISCVFVIRDHRSSYVGFYLIPVSVIITFFEITWILDKSACCIREGCCCRIWSGILFVDTWIKFLLYTVLSIPLFMGRDRILLGIISGLVLIILAALYLIKTFRSQVTVKVYKTVTRHRRHSSLVFHEMSTQTEEDLLEMVSAETPTPTASTSATTNETGEETTPETPPSPTGTNGNQDVPEDGGASSASPKQTKKK